MSKINKLLDISYWLVIKGDQGFSSYRFLRPIETHSFCFCDGDGKSKAFEFSVEYMDHFFQLFNTFGKYDNLISVA